MFIESQPLRRGEPPDGLALRSSGVTRASSLLRDIKLDVCASYWSRTNGK
jgi:hypothetical protein